MACRMWLLVEWIDERNMFPNYGVVSVDSLFNKSELNAGKTIYIPLKHGNGARRAQILRISDSKRELKDHKLFLQRQDHQVKNVVSLCMRSIQEMKTNPSLYFGPMSAGQQSLVGASSSAVYHEEAGTDSSSSGSEAESNLVVNETNHEVKPMVKHTALHKRLESSTVGQQIGSQSPLPSRRLLSSTPLPRTNENAVKLTFDQGTQTIETGERPPLAKVNELEDNLNKAYNEYLSLVAHLNSIKPNVPQDDLITPSDLEHTPTEDDTEDSDREQHVAAEEKRDEQSLINSNVEIEPNGHNLSARTLNVRRVSAHTTNAGVETSNAGISAEMVAIGAGNVTVPARLLNEINWDSYSTATRQLLQAVFPRRILATHSLSGKQSPAFANRPPKKQLDSSLVEDIVNTVSLRCSVPKRLVRSSITTKCTDEAKLYRNRQHRHARQSANPTPGYQENVPPSPASSHDGSYQPVD